MAHLEVGAPFLVHELGEIGDAAGRTFDARVIGALREDGLWDGYLEFIAANGGVLVSPRETRQPNLADLVYWSTGLGDVYLQGALSRAVDAHGAFRSRRALTPRRSSPASLRPSRAPRPARRTTRARGATSRLR